MDAIYGYIANWSSKVPLKTAKDLNLERPLGKLYGTDVAGTLVLDLKKMLPANIEFRSSKDAWQIRLADFVVTTWARTVLDFSGEAGFRELFLDLNRKTCLQGDQTIGAVQLTDSTEWTLAPAEFAIFRRIAQDDEKILPCG